MKSETRASLCISVILSVTTLVFFYLVSALFNEISILYLGLPFMFSTLLFSLVFLKQDNEEKSLKIRHSGRTARNLLVLLTVLCVLAVLVVPAYDGSILEWVNVPIVNWLRYLSSIILALFLPGYLLLRLLDTSNSIEFPAAVVLSYILSMFMDFVIGFGSLLIYESISSPAIYLVIAVDVALMIAYYFRSSPERSSESSVGLLELGAVLATLLVILIGNIYVMYNTLPLSLGDMWKHHAFALSYSRGFPVYDGLMVPNYPYLFYIYLAMLFQLSGLPSPIAYQSLFILSFVPAVSFYCAVKAWFPKEKNVSCTAVLLVSLLGFGSSLAICLVILHPDLTLEAIIWGTASKTYDITDIMIIGPSISNVVPTIYIGLPTFFISLYVLKRELKSSTRLVFFALIVAVSYLGHIGESAFIAVAVVSYSVIFRGERVKESALGGMFGLLIVFLIDSIAPARCYVLGFGNTISSTTVAFLITLLFFASSLALPPLIERFHIDRKRFSHIFMKSVSLFSWIIVYLYLFSIAVWLIVLPNYSAFEFGHYDFTPFFIWPLRFGPIGLLLIVCLAVYSNKIVKNRPLTFFLALLVIGFVLEQLANYYPIYSAYRFATLSLVGAVALAAYGVAKALPWASKRRKPLLAAALVILMSPGMLSTALSYYDRGSLRPNISNSELDALTYVGRNLPLNASVLTWTEDSATKLETFEGIDTIQVMQTWEYVFSRTIDPSVILYLLGTSNVKYIYLSQYDYESINPSENVLYNMLDYFPVGFKNDFVTVYGVPEIEPPSKTSSFIIPNFLDPFYAGYVEDISKSRAILQTLPGFLGLNYSISSIPTQANETQVVLDNFQNASEWAIVEGLGRISLDESDYVSGPTTIALKDFVSDKNGYSAFGKKDSWDLSQLDHLQLWTKIGNGVTGMLKVILRGDNGTWSGWLVRGFPLNTWFKSTFPLSKPDLESSTKIDLSRIRAIDIGFEGLQPFGHYSFLKVDSLMGVNTSLFPLKREASNLLGNPSTIMLTSDPDFNVSSLLSLVEAGSKILVFHTSGNDDGYFFSFLRLQENGFVNCDAIALPTRINLADNKIPLISIGSSNASVVFYYQLDETPVAPFMMVEALGLGEIIYVVLPSTVVSGLNSTLSSLMTIFRDIASQSGLRFSESKHASYYIGSYNTQEGLTEVDGRIGISTGQVSSIGPWDIRSIEISTNHSSIRLVNATLVDLQIYGPIRIFGDNSSVIMYTPYVSSYLTMLAEGHEGSYLFQLSNEARGDLKIVNSTGVFDVQISGGSILLNLSALRIVVRNPSIDVVGSISFESARIQYVNPYVPLEGVVRGSLTINGNTSFGILFMASNMMMIDNFSYVGVARANEVPTPHLEIPWLNLLVSPILLGFHLVVIAFVFLYVWRKRKIGAKYE